MAVAEDDLRDVVERMIYRCGCCLLSGTAKYKVSWCCAHDMYECAGCWEHAHPDTQGYSWGECCEEHANAYQDQGDADPGGPRRSDL